MFLRNVGSQLPDYMLRPNLNISFNEAFSSLDFTRQDDWMISEQRQNDWMISEQRQDDWMISEQRQDDWMISEKRQDDWMISEQRIG
jgi:hypothetical protein